MKNLAQRLKELEEEQLLAQVREMDADGTKPLEILQDLQEGMRLVGEEFEKGNYFLSELIMSTTIFQEALEIIKDKLARDKGEAEYGTFVIGTVKDDIHDIGKNIAAALLSCRGFNVVDLGVDVPVEKFLEAVKTHKPKVLGLSCLLTTCFENMKETIDAVEKAGLRSGLPIIIGGATIDEKTSKHVGADAFCLNANEAVLTARRLIGGVE